MNSWGSVSIYRFILLLPNIQFTMSIHITDKDDHSPPKDHLEDVEKPAQSATFEDVEKPAQSATYDDVFGEISEQGPNYRNVSVFGGIFCYEGERGAEHRPGRRVWDHCPTDEDPGWAWSVIHPICLRYPGHGTRRDLSFGGGCDYNVVCL